MNFIQIPPYMQLVPGRAHVRNEFHYFLGTDEHRRFKIRADHIALDDGNGQPYNGYLLFETVEERDAWHDEQDWLQSSYHRGQEEKSFDAFHTFYRTTWYRRYQRFERTFGAARVPYQLHQIVQDVQHARRDPLTVFPAKIQLRQCGCNGCYRVDVPGSNQAFIPCGYCGQSFHSEACMQAHIGSCFRRCANCNIRETVQGQFWCCGYCRAVYFCAKTCQKFHWRASHKVDCPRTHMVQVARTQP